MTARGLIFMCLLAATPAAAQADRWFVTSDGVRLHYTESGAARNPTLVLVPGWTMPGWIFHPQVQAFSPSYHVVAFDPRGQGDSQAPATGYEPGRRGQDIAELIARVDNRPVLLLGWSLGVLDTLAYVHTHGDGRVAGLVLVDNSIGEEPAPPPPRPPRHPPRPLPREVAMHAFVASMFHRHQPASYIDELTEVALRTPDDAARDLLHYPVPRTYWRDAVYSTGRPILYVVRPAFEEQAENLARRDAAAEIAVIRDAGHALFIDDATRFDAMLADFIRRRVWP